MSTISKTFEQYCCIKEKNVPVVEIIKSDGSKCLRCAMIIDCEKCNNRILKKRFGCKS